MGVGVRGWTCKDRELVIGNRQQGTGNRVQTRGYREQVTGTVMSDQSRDEAEVHAGAAIRGAEAFQAKSSNRRNAASAQAHGIHSDGTPPWSWYQKTRPE
jgi:hypothetical protein